MPEPRSGSHPARGAARGAATSSLTSAVVFVVVLGGAALGVEALLSRVSAPVAVPERCAAELDGTAWYLAPDQAETAALLATATVRRGMPARAATIAIATGLQESSLRNIDYGDRDSIGIFQQRPSQGWGTVEQIMDPVYSTGAFLDALEQVDGYQDLPVTVAAQTVQRSAFPDAYAQHEVRSRAWASALTGHAPATLTCELREADAPGDAAGLTIRAARDLGLTPVAEESGALVLDAGALAAAGAAGGDPARAGWVVAQWAVSMAHPLGVVQVEHEGQVWQRETAAWESPQDGSATGSGQVRVTLAD